MKLKISLSRNEAAVLLQRMNDTSALRTWLPHVQYWTASQTDKDGRICKVSFSMDGKKYTLTPEIVQRGANAAIQPEAGVNADIQEEIKSGSLDLSVRALNIIAQCGLFGKVILP